MMVVEDVLSEEIDDKWTTGASPYSVPEEPVMKRNGVLRITLDGAGASLGPPVASPGRH